VSDPNNPYGSPSDPNNPYGAQPQYGQPAGADPNAYYGGLSGAAKPSNNLVWGILTTLLCCLPLGIVSIVFSTKVDGLWAQGQYAQAQEAADNAKKWAIIGIVIGVVFEIILIGAWIALVMFGAATTTTTYNY
jgi:hypothetical protein